MLRSVLMDKLSEFLMVEQGGYQLYTVVEARCTNPELKAKYIQFLEQTNHHREVLVRLIEQLGGDPNYISPTARVAQFKATQLMESSLVVDGLSQPEIEANDLENVLLAETKDHSDWSLLKHMAAQTQASGRGKVGQKIGSAAGAAMSAANGGSAEQVDMALLAQVLPAAVAEVEPQEDEHLTWAREKLAELSMQMGTTGPAPSPLRWQELISAPTTPLSDDHPAPITEGLLEYAGAPQWVPSPVARTLR